MGAPVKDNILSLENEANLHMLCNMLRRSQGFRIGFARANHRTLRDRMAAEIRCRLPGTKIREIQLDRTSEAGVVTQLEAALGDEQPDALFVYGLESTFDLTVRQSPKMTILNLNRNYCGKRFPFPVVFWMPEFGIREFMKQAPDFWAWRSGLYLFTGEEEDIAATRSVLERGFDWNLNLTEKRERREVLQHLLAELQAQPQPDQRELARLHALVGEAAGFEGECSVACEHLERARQLYRRLRDERGEANCIRAIGDREFFEARYNKAAERFRDALQMYRKIGDTLGEAHCIWTLGNVVFQQGRNKEAADQYRTALPMYRQLRGSARRGQLHPGTGGRCTLRGPV